MESFQGAYYLRYVAVRESLAEKEARKGVYGLDYLDAQKVYVILIVYCARRSVVGL